MNITTETKSNAHLARDLFDFMTGGFIDRLNGIERLRNDEKEKILTKIEEVFSQAEKEIQVLLISRANNPLGDKRSLKALELAAQRGVNVEIVFSKLKNFDQIKNWGIKLWKTSQKANVSIALVDGPQGTLIGAMDEKKVYFVKQPRDYVGFRSAFENAKLEAEES